MWIVYYSKIIFKYVNSIVKPNFNLTFAEIYIYESHEQFTKPKKKTPNKVSLFGAIQAQPNYHVAVTK